MDIYLILSLITLPLAIWRLSNMFADTDQEGLFNSLDWIRNRSGVTYKDYPSYGQYNQPYGEPGSIAALMLCLYCSSIWFGVIFSIMLFCSTKLTFFVSLPFALSSMTIFIGDWRNRD